MRGKLTEQELTDESASALLRRIKAQKEKLIEAGKPKKEEKLSTLKGEEIPVELLVNWIWYRYCKLI